MGKRKKFDSKNVKINETPLSITKIGEMNTAEQSPFFVLFLFLFLLAFVFFLPTIVERFNKEDEKPDYSLNTSTDKNKDNEPLKKEEVKYYTFDSNLSLYLEENILVDHFTLQNQILTFSISNNGTSRFDFNKRNYFLELYTENNTLLERVMLTKETIQKDATISYTYELVNTNTNEIKKIAFLEKEEADYLNVFLEKDEVGNEVLVCTKKEETLTYKFMDDKLHTIEDSVQYTNSGVDSTYEQNKLLWQNRSNAYSSITGIVSTFLDVGNTFLVNTTLDLKNTPASLVDNPYYYKYETSPKVVSFEMQAQGFRCK